MSSCVCTFVVLTFLSAPGCGFKGHAVHIIILHTIRLRFVWVNDETSANSIAGEAILGYTRAFLVLFSLSARRSRRTPYNIIYKYIKKFFATHTEWVSEWLRAPIIIFLSRRSIARRMSWVIGGTYACVTYCQVLVSPAHVCHLIANTILHWSCDDELHFDEKVKGDDVRYALWFLLTRGQCKCRGLIKRKWP